MPNNHYKRWNTSELNQIKSISSKLNTKQEMYKIAPALAKQFGRTESAICKKIEENKGWYWAS